LVHTSPELIKDGTNGDIACDSYHKYKEDVALVKKLNVIFSFTSNSNTLKIIHTLLFHNFYNLFSWSFIVFQYHGLE